MGKRVSPTTEALARVKIDALLKDAGWDLADGTGVLFEYTLPAVRAPTTCSATVQAVQLGLTATPCTVEPHELPDPEDGRFVRVASPFGRHGVRGGSCPRGPDSRPCGRRHTPEGCPSVRRALPRATTVGSAPGCCQIAREVSEGPRRPPAIVFGTPPSPGGSSATWRTVP